MQTHAHLRERLLSSVLCILGVAEHVACEPLDPRSVAGAERVERGPVAGLRTCHENRVTQLLVDRDGLRAQRCRMAFTTALV